LAACNRLQRPIRRSHAKLRRAYRDLLLDHRVRTTGLDSNVEPLVFVVALDQRGIEAPMFRLRIPVGLQRDFG